MSGISLYNIEESLAELISAREELIAEVEIAAASTKVTEKPVEESRKELAEVERLLMEYAEREVRKVDGWHSAIRRMETDLDAEEQELAAIKVRRDRTKASLKRLKEAGVAVLQHFEKKEFVGTAGRKLRRQVNGGLAPLQVDGWDEEKGIWTGPEVLPSEYQNITVKLPLDDWNKLRSAASVFGSVGKVIGIEPANGRIREALAVVCPVCHGREPQRCCNGVDCGCQGLPIEPPCEACDGTGKQKIPGARILDRAEYLRIT